MRRRAARALIEVAIAGMFLIGVAAYRAHADFTGNDALVWAWRVGLAVALVFFTALRIAMGRPTGSRTPFSRDQSDVSP